MKAILVSVDYGDILQYTLPYNRHHFDEVMVVTTPTDEVTIEIARDNNARLCCTQAFYDQGADFNKWKALEQGLDMLGRDGWLCLMDADVVWPRDIGRPTYAPNRLYTPIAHTIPMAKLPPGIIPPEDEWKNYRERGNQTEWPGYTQIFHSSDRHLPMPPWHDINWRHAGGADSFFQRRWTSQCKERPPFEVLHIGESGKNWCGRVTRYLDGTTPEGAGARSEQLKYYFRKRRQSIRRTRKFTHETFVHERISPASNED